MHRYLLTQIAEHTALVVGATRETAAEEGGGGTGTILYKSQGSTGASERVGHNLPSGSPCDGLTLWARTVWVRRWNEKHRWLQRA